VLRRSRREARRDERAADGRDERSHDSHQPHMLLRLQRTIGNRGVQRMHATARVVQRQPDTSDAGPIGDPMEFIEGQLARAFADPDDPRLSVRVQRLLEAAQKLALSEAKQLLDKLAHDRRDKISRDFQRLATPSRNKLLAALRRRLPSDIEGKRLGTLNTGTGLTATSTPLTAAAEIVPSTEEPGSFAGYDDEAAARRTAVRRPTISAIVKDRRMGLHRVFETGVPTVRQGSFTISANETGADHELTDWVNVEGSALPDPGDRAARIKHARKLLDEFLKSYGQRMGTIDWLGQQGPADPVRDAALQQVQDAYRALVEEAIPFARSELHPSLELEVRDPRDPKAAPHKLTTASPSAINIDLSGMYVHGFQAVLDPMSGGLGIPGAHTKTSMPTLFQDMPPVPYEPYLALTPSAVAEDPLHTLSVLLHEEAHLAHSRRTVQLFERWSESPGLSFKNWVQNEVAQRRVSPVDAALALELSEKPPTGWFFNTELLAELEGFTAGYHTVSPQNRSLFLDRIPTMGTRWGHSASEVQELAIKKLRYYYQRMLGESEREAFDVYVAEQMANATAASNVPFDFYVRLAEFAATP
jgi:hypothetical protein